jgi:Response regulators consisting of a CheY-like receiver domain and a winged-helix DNA-binding domain
MKILVVEDDQPLLKTLIAILEEESYEVEFAVDGDNGLYLAERNIYDLLIFDIMLPYKSGLSIVKELRSKEILTPILLLTAKDSVQDRVNGLDAGADDYLVKPFAVEELLARVRALLRRNRPVDEDELRYGPISLRSSEHEGFLDGKPLKLTIKEYELLEYLLYNREQILTREQIFDRVWGLDSEAAISMVDVYVHFLRKKLSQCGEYIRTIRGVGYVFRKE